MDGDHLLDVLRARATGPSLAEEIRALERDRSWGRGRAAVRTLRARHRAEALRRGSVELRATAAELSEESRALAAEAEQALRRAACARRG